MDAVAALRYSSSAGGALRSPVALELPPALGTVTVNSVFHWMHVAVDGCSESVWFGHKLGMMVSLVEEQSFIGIVVNGSLSVLPMEPRQERVAQANKQRGVQAGKPSRIRVSWRAVRVPRSETRVGAE